MNWQETPVFIINRNNLERGFRRLVEWLQCAGMSEITVIDNQSTWEPLLTFYETAKIEVLRQTRNVGPYVFWDLNMQDFQTTRFIVTDPDVVPDIDCPNDLVRKMHEICDRYPGARAKVGPGLRIDNLPEHYCFRQRVIEWETQFWLKQLSEGDVFDAEIDTTFALYEPGSPCWTPQHFRLSSPYLLEHVPWYEDSGSVSEEREFYKVNANPGWINW